jgi:uncharacterized protein YehS (DUF1456 family)
MTNNDVLRRLRYILDLNDSAMISIFGEADLVVTREEISDWLKKDDDPAFVSCNDKLMATFLNGLINHKRGRKEGKQPQPEKTLTNNIVLKKLRIALDLKSEDILDLLELADLYLSKHELSAFFRKPDHKHYRVCKDQVMRNFLQGLQIKHRPESQGEDSVWN